MDALKKIGLNEYEIKIYEMLLAYGKSNAKKVAEKSTVPPTAVYPNLKSLKKKGLIQEIEAEVMLFEATDPSQAISSYIEKRKDELDNLGKEITTTLEVIKNKEKFIETPEIITISQGIQSSQQIYFDLFKKTTKSFYAIGWGFLVKKNMYAFLQQLKDMKKRGIDVRLIITSMQEEEATQLHKKTGIEMKYLDIKNISFTIIDSAECKITLKNPQIGERYNMQIADKDLSKALNDYFLILWKRASKVE
ncbi:MAG: helix-turn-helix domain-containing protein [Candidatus Woesearchaeota archaeon]